MKTKRRESKECKRFSNILKRNRCNKDKVFISKMITKIKSNIKNTNNSRMKSIINTRYSNKKRKIKFNLLRNNNLNNWTK